MKELMGDKRKTHKAPAKLQAQPESFRAVTISESDDGGIKCYTCNEEGHKACQCRKQRKSLISHSTQKKKGGPAAHSLKSSPDKACSAFTLQHLYTTDKGKTLFRTQLSNYPMSLADTIKQYQGCVLCLDLTGKHDGSNCTS